MRISVIVKTKVRREAVKQINKDTVLVAVKAVPEKGKANMSVISLLSEHFDTAKSNIKIISGSYSKHKIIEISSEIT